MTPLVSIIIPARNARHTLGLLLDDLTEMALDGRAEVIVVDDASVDGTAELVDRRAQELGGLRLVTGPGGGPAAARNAGAAAAAGNWLAFTDADVRLPQDWLERG